MFPVPCCAASPPTASRQLASSVSSLTSSAALRAPRAARQLWSSGGRASQRAASAGENEVFLDEDAAGAAGLMRRSFHSKSGPRKHTKSTVCCDFVQRDGVFLNQAARLLLQGLMAKGNVPFPQFEWNRIIFLCVLSSELSSVCFFTPRVRIEKKKCPLNIKIHLFEAERESDLLVAPQELQASGAVTPSETNELLLVFFPLWTSCSPP